VDADVRNAFLDLRAAADQVRVAQSNVALAQDTLRQARDRFGAGVTDTIEVVQAQETLAMAELDYISSLYAHNIGKVTLARAVGRTQERIQEFLSLR
jgi:outer membrane protein TolC